MGTNVAIAGISSGPARENGMAKIAFTLKGVTKEIRKAEKKLRSIRRKVIKADQKRIDLHLRALKKSYGLIGAACFDRPHRPRHFGQTFRSKL
jgi:hypothetical protein